MKFRAASRWKTPLTAWPRPRSVSESGFHRRGRRNAGLTREEILNAVSLAWVDGQSCAPIAMRRTPARVNPGRRASHFPRGTSGTDGENGRNGLPSALTAPVWGFYDVSFKGESFASSARTVPTLWKMCCSKSPSGGVPLPDGS